MRLRHLLKALALSLIGLPSIVLADEKPNIVIILTDDQGWADTSVRMMKDRPDSRSEFFRTPALEKMAKEGMIFTDAHTSSSVCTPSRYALLTGRYNWRTRLQRGVVQGGDEFGPGRYMAHCGPSRRQAPATRTE